MLRRIASHLFWTARNLERAEWRARLLDVNYHLLIESPPRDGQAWAPLLAIFGERELFAESYTTADDASILNFFALDIDNPNSIRSCINTARSNAISLRHYISTELWLDLNTLYLNAQEWTPELFVSPGVFAFFADLKDSFYRLSGIRQSTIPRDIAYDFMQLGIMLERTEDVSRMLDVKYHFLLPRLEDVGGSLDILQWAAVLRSASGLEAYRKRFGNSIRIDNVVEVLLFDPTFPRSARFALAMFATSINRIKNQGPEPSPPSSQLEELLNLLNSKRPLEVIKSGLHQFLIEIQDGCAALGDEVFQRYLKVD
jgi:uncharacterized alpha-E superfamily protein